MSSSTLSLTVASQPHVLTIAGSDSSGGAGIQADLKTIAALGCYGSSVLTGLTAQNTQGVQGVHEVPSDFVIQQLESVLSDCPPATIKLGMLTSTSTILALSTYLSTLPTSTRPPLVLDPVMISTSGHTLLPASSISAIKAQLLPLCSLVTPNLPEAQALAGRVQPVKSLADMLELADEFRAACGSGSQGMVLLKGGHLTVSRKEVLQVVGNGQGIEVVWDEGDEEEDTVEVLRGLRETVGLEGAGKDELVADILVENAAEGEGRKTMFVGRKLDSTSTHGTGCTLSSAIASYWAIWDVRDHPDEEERGDKFRTICRQAIAYTRSAIASAFPFGSGHGPLNHSHLTTARALPPPTSLNPHPFLDHLIQSNLPLWRSYVRHPFVVQLGQGTLPRECFEHYIKQDYHYLRHYARAHALGAYKASSFEDISAFTAIAAHIAKESEMHVAYCAEFGITLDQLKATPESSPCAAYARYILDIGTQGDILDLYMGVASCLIGYGEVGLWLQKRVETGEAVLEGNLYRRWMEDYAGADFIGAVNRGIDNLERRVAADPPSPKRLAELTRIWHECLRLERDFWEMGLKLGGD